MVGSMHGCSDVEHIASTPAVMQRLLQRWSTSRGPAVIAVRAPVMEYVHQFLQSVPSSEHVRQQWRTSHHLLQEIAAFAPVVEHISRVLQ